MATSSEKSVLKNILLVKDYRLMFKNCAPINFYENNQDDIKVIENIEFDGFDWNRDMKDAYSNH